MSPGDGRIGVAVLGAPGAVGQRFIERLHDHPTFRIEALVGQSSVGQPYREAANWILDGDVPASVADLVVTDLEALDPAAAPVVFSALPGKVARETESALAEAGHKVFTNASAHRMDPDVPLLIPEVNADHLRMVEAQPGPGFIVANGNCSGIVLTLALAPLHRAFGLQSLDVTTMQGLSGAGYPGVSGLDVIDNIVPFIGGEEDKLETEPQKTLGVLAGTGRDAAVTPAVFTVRATCTRVPVREGHFESVHATLAEPTTAEAVRAAFAEFTGPADVAGLHSAPARPIHVLDAPDRPQPRRDRDLEAGMAVSVGRIRLDAAGTGVRFVVLGHNTVRGAAGQSVLNAEYAAAKGLL